MLIGILWLKDYGEEEMDLDFLKELEYEIFNLIIKFTLLSKCLSTLKMFSSKNKAQRNWIFHHFIAKKTNLNILSMM